MNEDTFFISLGKRIKELRLERGLSQEMLAGQARINRTYIGVIENAKSKPSLSTLLKLSRVLKVEVRDFFDF